MQTVLITGSNRGLGLEWTRQYAEAGYRVYATCRHPMEQDALRSLVEVYNNVSIHRMDVTRPEEINAVSVFLGKEPIDILVNNAGVYLEKFKEIGLGSIRYEDWHYTLSVNTLGAVRVTEAFQENLAQSERGLSVVISTHMASIADINAPGSYYYRSTKAALNAAMVGVAHELKSKGIGVLILHPGWVRTRMGGEKAIYSVTESVEGMREQIKNFSMKDSGRFLRFDGVELPW